MPAAKTDRVALLPDPIQLLKVFFYQTVVDAILRHKRAVIEYPLLQFNSIPGKAFDVTFCLIWIYDIITI